MVVVLIAVFMLALVLVLEVTQCSSGCGACAGLFGRNGGGRWRLAHWRWSR